MEKCHHCGSKGHKSHEHKHKVKAKTHALKEKAEYFKGERAAKKTDNYTPKHE